MAKPTHQDATLMLQLYRVWAEMDLSDAIGWVWSDEFIPEYAEFLKEYPAGSEGFVHASKVCQWFETLGALYKHGLFSEELSSTGWPWTWCGRGSRVSPSGCGRALTTRGYTRSSKLWPRPTKNDSKRQTYPF